tara:strand:+ start:334 stop:618 length:285 start_codon:yes stop_codon:yes gene_type:complete
MSKTDQRCKFWEDHSVFDVNKRHGNGIFITLKNGYTVSIQWGEFNYAGKDTAETALLNSSGSFVPYGKMTGLDDVQSHMDIDEIIELLNYAKEL